MSEPVLLVMAAGMGSRYGGLKQMDTIGDNGEWLLDFSLYDAHRAGFKKVVFIVREEILQDFKDTIGDRIEGALSADYAVQSLCDLPGGYNVPEGRVKPWGTAHAVYSARKQIGDSPFMVINADDYYGAQAFREIYNYLSNGSAGQNLDKQKYAMVGYQLGNTVTEHGHVARGVCRVDQEGYLENITERVCIKVFGDAVRYSEDDGKNWTDLHKETPVSLNCWGFDSGLMQELEQQLLKFLQDLPADKELESEYFLPTVVENMMEQDKAEVKVLQSKDRWYGVTYREDKEKVAQALTKFKKEKLYPQDLWA